MVAWITASAGLLVRPNVACLDYWAVVPTSLRNAVTIFKKEKLLKFIGFGTVPEPLSGWAIRRSLERALSGEYRLVGWKNLWQHVAISPVFTRNATILK